jgi:broad specificity phosphatase PhoE
LRSIVIYDQIEQNRIERLKFGTFYYRFPNGESGADVYDRMCTFMASLHRELLDEKAAENFVIVSHGITIRMFLMRYYRLTVDEYERLWNPENTQFVVLERRPNSMKYFGVSKVVRNSNAE